MDKIAERQASYNRYESLRKKMGYESDYQVIKETGIAKSTFSEWKSGAYAPKLDKMLKISKCLGVPLEELVGAS